MKNFDMKKEKILVTGGCGFIGSNLVDKLIELGHEVWIIDDMSSDSASIKNRNSDAFYVNESVENICHINDFVGFKFDKIFHLAAKARIQPSFKNPREYFNSNAIGTFEILEFARITGSEKLIYATTSSKNSSMSSTGSPYTYTKVIGEGLLKLYSTCYNLKCVSATFYNVYGPREPQEGEWATVVAKFLRQYRNNEPLTVIGDGNQTREFTHVFDIVNGLIAISDMPTYNEHFKGGNLDLSSGVPIKILDIAKTICQDKGSIRFVSNSGRKNEAANCCSNYKATENSIGWLAKYKLMDYLKIERAC
jgi:UDP-glucose 4-epimerase